MSKKVELKVGDKIQITSGMLGVQNGVIIKNTNPKFIGPAVRWDTAKENDVEDFCGGCSFVMLEGKLLPNDWKFTYINSDGSLK